MLSTEYDLSSFPAGSVKFQFEVLESLTLSTKSLMMTSNGADGFGGFPQTANVEYATIVDGVYVMRNF